jgi:hypothetical protein
VSESAQLRAELAELHAGLAEAQEPIRDLQRVLVAKDEQIAALQADNERLRAENAELKARVAELERWLRMNSGNSSLPPSSDRFAKPKPKPRSCGKTAGASRAKAMGALLPAPNNNVLFCADQGEGLPGRYHPANESGLGDRVVGGKGCKTRHNQHRPREDSASPAVLALQQQRHGRADHRAIHRQRSPRIQRSDDNGIAFTPPPRLAGYGHGAAEGAGPPRP